MKKILALALAIMMVLSLAACGGGNEETPSGSGGSTPGSSEQQEQPSDTPDEDKNDGPDVSGEWPDNEWTELVSKPTTGTITGHSYLDSMGLYYVYIADWSLEDAEAYMNELAAIGFVDRFTDGEPEMDDKTSLRKCYEAQMKNSNGYEASVVFYPESNEGNIILSEED